MTCFVRVVIRRTQSAWNLFRNGLFSAVAEPACSVVPRLQQLRCNDLAALLLIKHSSAFLGNRLTSSRSPCQHGSNERLREGRANEWTINGSQRAHRRLPASFLWRTRRSTRSLAHRVEDDSRDIEYRVAVCNCARGWLRDWRDM